MIYREVPLLIAEVVGFTGFCLIDIGEIPEFESVIHQFSLMHFGFPVRIEFLKDTPVLSQDVIDVPHEVCLIAVGAIIKSGAALLGAKALVGAAVKLGSALRAFLFHWFLQF